MIIQVLRDAKPYETHDAGSRSLPPWIKNALNDGLRYLRAYAHIPGVYLSRTVINNRIYTAYLYREG